MEAYRVVDAKYPLLLWDVKDPTLLDSRLKDGGKVVPYAPAALLSPTT
jgi:hypothetical protein